MMIVRSRAQVRTLVVHAGGLGDFLLFCPTLKRLAEEGPVDLAGPYRDRLNLAVVCGIARTAHHSDDFDFASVFAAPTKTFERFVCGYDRVVVWMNDENGRIQTALRDAGVGDVRVNPGLPPQDWNRPASAYYGEQLNQFDLAPLVLPIESDGYEHDVVIHAGSGGPKKNWPLKNFAALSARLIAAGRRVTWSRGPAEEGLKPPQDADVLEVPSVVTLARHLSGTRLYLGNDSGVTHLAAACGCKTVAIFGPTDPAVWAPLGEHVCVMKSDCWVGVDAVMSAIAGLC